MSAVTTTIHVLNLAGNNFHIDGETRKEVERFLRDEETGLRSYILIDTLAGEEVTVVADAVNGLWSSTPETREWYRQSAAEMEAEHIP